MFCRHLKENKITYIQHFRRSLYYSAKSFQCSVMFLVHAILPWCFEYDGSRSIKKLNEEMK